MRRAKERFGVSSLNDLKALHKKTKCSVESMEKILNKGRGAYYSSGSRPNQTAESWAIARLGSALTGGPSAKYDMHLLKEGNCSPEVIRGS